MREYGYNTRRSSLILKNRIYFIIRYAMLAALLAAVIIIAASGKKESKSSFAAVSEAVTRLATSEYMEESPARYMKKIYGLNPEDYENILIYIPTTNMSAQELLLVKLRSADQSDAVVEAIENRMESQYNIFEGYAPEQVAILDNAVVDPQGNYILYISGDNAEKIDEAFRSSL